MLAGSASVHLPLLRLVFVRVPIPWYVPLIVLAVAGLAAWIAITLAKRKQGR